MLLSRRCVRWAVSLRAFPATCCTPDVALTSLANVHDCDEKCLAKAARVPSFVFTPAAALAAFSSAVAVPTAPGPGQLLDLFPSPPITSTVAFEAPRNAASAPGVHPLPSIR
eukprot:CAMPEP_0194316148 /NCGR_PEP_ID=MMETSP0171-20130528/12961_1 /TAXON_ID=218684 /ORGANISM="Corethron pennatum, Strain L29A3" /LENGTH=111 /DNA_ID=CAMNT_0039072283 /DNA_START=666 /DNA_END=998 /DNA_ORIENTATION=-